MKNIVIQLSLLLILTGCAKSLIPMPISVMPERNTERVSSESYGDYPYKYQKIVKDFLQKNLLNHEDAKVEFINKPSKISVTQMGTDYNGYRLCLSINSRNGKSIYSGYKTHLFLINNSEVKLHLFDSGLLKIPFELCVDTNESNTLFLNEIPDEAEEIPLDKMDSIDLTDEPITKTVDKSNIYILCQLNDMERTFYFNEFDRKFVESEGINELLLNGIKFSNTHILGYNKNEEILINRVSGSVIITQDTSDPEKGNCSLLDRKKF